MTAASGTRRCATPYGVECAFGGLGALLEGIDECLRSLSDGLAPVAEVYLEGARGNLIHARDALRKAVEPDCGARWRIRVEKGAAAEQVGDGSPLSWREADRDEPIGYARADLGACLVGSRRITRGRSFDHLRYMVMRIAREAGLVVKFGALQNQGGQFRRLARYPPIDLFQACSLAAGLSNLLRAPEGCHTQHDAEQRLERVGAA